MREIKKVEKAKKFLSRMIFSLAGITSATHWLDVNEIEDLPLKNGWARDNSFQHWDPSVHFYFQTKEIDIIDYTLKTPPWAQKTENISGIVV